MLLDDFATLELTDLYGCGDSHPARICKFHTSEHATILGLDIVCAMTLLAISAGSSSPVGHWAAAHSKA